MDTKNRLVAMLLGVLPLAGALGQAKALERQWEIKPTTLPVVLEGQFPEDVLVQN